jgi:hypothetical protein
VAKEDKQLAALRQWARVNALDPRLIAKLNPRQVAALLQWQSKHGPNEKTLKVLAERDPKRQRERFAKWLAERKSREPKRKRKPGGGRKNALTPKQIAKLQGIYRRVLRKDPALRKDEGAIAMLKEHTSKSPSTLLRHVIRPVRNPQKSK